MSYSSTSSRWWLLLTVPFFLLLSCYFFYVTFSFTQPLNATDVPELSQSWYVVDTAREEIIRNSVMVGNCHLCHSYWVPIPTSTQTSNPRFAHANLQLEHGTNDRCYNCHLISDRNKYIADDGSPIMTQTPEQLCKRCHGLVYKDWVHGTHGKWTGNYRNDTLFSRITYSCTQCHDPHNPSFRYQIFAPPPVWPDKYIRETVHTTENVMLKNFFIEDHPEEIF